MFKDTYTRALPVCGASLLALCIGAPVLRMTDADGPETFQLATGDQLAPLPLSGIRSIAATWAAGQNVTGQGHAPAKGFHPRGIVCVPRDLPASARSRLQRDHALRRTPDASPRHHEAARRSP